jgi:hypothetical protein
LAARLIAEGGRRMALETQQSPHAFSANLPASCRQDPFFLKQPFSSHEENNNRHLGSIKTCRDDDDDYDDDKPAFCQLA